MTTKIKPSSPGQLQCQTLESLCWCPGCCSFQRPDFASWIIRPSHYIWYMIYHISYMIYHISYMVEKRPERSTPRSERDFYRQPLLRSVRKEGAWNNRLGPNKSSTASNNICLDVLLKYWQNLEDHVVLPDVRVVCDGNILGHFGDPRNRNCGKVAANLRRRSFLSPSSLSYLIFVTNATNIFV